MNEQIESGSINRDEVISLTQRSARRREYEMRAGEAALGWLRWPTGRRSVAQAEGQGIGLIELTARRRRVLVTGGQDGADTMATVEREGGGAVIRAVEGRPLRWERTGRGNRWALSEGEAVLLSFAASQGLLKSSVRIAVDRVMPEEAVVLLCLIGGFLALEELQYGIDGSAAIGGIVAGGAG